MFFFNMVQLYRLGGDFMDNDDKNLKDKINNSEEDNLLDNESIIDDENINNIDDQTLVNTNNNVPSNRQNFYGYRQNIKKLNNNIYQNKLPNQNKNNNQNQKDSNLNKNNNLTQNSLSNNNASNRINEAKNLLNAAEKAKEEGKSQTAAVVKEQAKMQIKKKVIAFIIANLPTILIVCGVLVLILILILILTVLFGSYYGEETNNYEYRCSTISINTTSLSKEEFVNRLQSSSVKEAFKTNASKIYEISSNNNINPEMVVIRASVEGYSPGINNNYWGMGCTNTGGKKACLTYNSFDAGVLGYINNIKKYATVEEMVSKYAYIGANWYNPGDSSKGGCYYFPHIKEFMSSERASQVESYCASNRRCSGTSCPSTTSEDQEAYSKWQVKRMVEERERIFNVGEDECEEMGSSEEVEDDGTLGSQVASYAVETFDSYSYSQDRRFSAGYVDCSSMVYRAYNHFGYTFGGATTAAAEFIWCKNNNKLVNESELKAGDLIFFNKGSHYSSNKAYGIGHVTMYIGNNKQFSARSSRYDQPDQVAVTNYSRGAGTYFCRPYK